MATVRAILDFLIEIFTVDRLVKMRRRTKFRGDPSNRWELYLTVIQNGGRLPSWIFENSNFQLCVRFRRSVGSSCKIS